VFLDALIGHGSLNFDNTRWVTSDNTTVSGKRDGNTWFGSIGLTSEFRNGAFKFAPYLRLDAMTARLNQYSESGDPTQALTYQAVNISSTAAVVGLRGTVDIKDDDDTYTPNLRLEYKRALDRGFTQSLFYNETGSSQLYAINQGDMTQDIFTGAIGVRARFGSATTLEVEYSLSGTPSGPASWQSQMVRAMAHWNFTAN
jgi:large repetitive protein